MPSSEALPLPYIMACVLAPFFLSILSVLKIPISMIYLKHIYYHVALKWILDRRSYSSKPMFLYSLGMILFPLQSKVHQRSHLHNMVETNKSKQTNPVTFDWTGINYPRQWEVKYKEPMNQDIYVQKIETFLNTLISFDRSSHSFRIPEGHPTPRFTPPLLRTPSVNNVDFKSNRHEPASSTLVQPSFSGVYDTEHKGQHSDCPAYNKILQRLKHKQNRELLSFYMFSSLPRNGSGMEITSAKGDRSYVPGRNLLDVPFR